MNNTFNIKRFGFVFRKDLIENGKQYALLFLTMFGLITLVITYYTVNNSDHYVNFPLIINTNLLIFIMFMFFGFGTWFASTFSTPMNRKLKRLSYLISPASHLEKYLVRWIVTTIGFIIAFFLAMWIADVLRVAICSVVCPNVDIKFIDLTKIVSPDQFTFHTGFVVTKNVFVIMVSSYFLLQSIFLLGSTFWEKATFIKTFTAGAVIFVAYIIICRWAMVLFFGGLIGYDIVIKSFEWDQKYTAQQLNTFTAIVITTFTLTCWILTYFRMKESEIIERL